MRTDPANATIAAFEAHIELGPTFAARLLGVAYPTYAQYRSGRRSLPQYHVNHIHALLGLSPVALGKQIERWVYGQ